MIMYRTYYNGELRANNEKEKVKLVGWVSKKKLWPIVLHRFAGYDRDHAARL